MTRDVPIHARVMTLYVGGVHASRVPMEVQTILGSCIAACLFDPVHHIGGMNHFLLPHGARDKGSSTRYGVHAMEVLINKIMSLGGDRRRLQAKVFGGGHVLQVDPVGVSVSEQNVGFIKEFLATERIPICAQRLGGFNPVRVRFFTETGKVLVQPLGKGTGREVADVEERYRLDVLKQIERPHTDNVTLF